MKYGIIRLGGQIKRRSEESDGQFIGTLPGDQRSTIQESPSLNRHPEGSIAARTAHEKLSRMRCTLSPTMKRTSEEDVEPFLEVSS